MEGQRTTAQNRALHLLFTQIAEALNESGLDVREVIKVDTPWNSYLVKDILWRTIQRKVVRKEHTSDLSKDEIDKIYEILNRALGEKGIHVPFPSQETLYEKND